VTVALLCVALFSSTVTGALLLVLLGPADVPRLTRFALGTPTAFLLGLAAHSVWHLIWLGVLHGAGARPFYAIYDSMLPLGLLALGRYRRRFVASGSYFNSSPLRGGGWQKLALGAATALVLFQALALIVVLASRQPHGWWDAWTMWNHKALWFTLARSSWGQVLLDPAFAQLHPDYPLALPLAIARLWLYTGGIPTIVPETVSVASGFATMLLVCGGASLLRGPVAGSVAAASFLIVPSFVVQSGWQCADVPLSGLFAATVVAIASGMSRSGTRNWFVLAGTCAGAGLWMKNEGVLFAVAAAIAIGLLSAGRRRQNLAAFVLGAVPFIAVVVTMKLGFAGANDLFSTPTPSSIWQRIVDPARHLQILGFIRTMARAMVNPTGMLLLLGYVAVGGWHSDRRPGLAALLITALSTAGFYGIFLITPHDLDWHLDTAAPRLVIQLWPSAILALVYLTHSPVVLNEGPAAALQTSLRPSDRPDDSADVTRFEPVEFCALQCPSLPAAGSRARRRRTASRLRGVLSRRRDRVRAAVAGRAAVSTVAS